ncbi:MAG: TIR domain-containing protein [Hyphomonadaceae bacterium]|nr:TIR domain-containing protein [Hyphomonadaceae bacterium]
MADLFISYSREDKPRAEQVARGLSQAGFDVFWDTEIPPGTTWADYIESKLANCAAVVVLWSQHSTRSQWVREEARMGKERGKLIPAMLDASAPPFGFGEVQAANLSTWQGQAGHPDWDNLVNAVRSAVGASGGARPPEQRRPQPQAFAPPHGGQAKKGGLPMPLLIGGGVVAALLVVLGVLGATNKGGGDAPQPVVQQPAPQAFAPPVQQAQPAAGGQQVDYAAQLQSQLAVAEQALGAQGFRLIAGPFSGGLAQGANQSFPITLEQGGDYRIVGVCDNDCSDLDLQLRDQSNNVVQQDTSTDDHPVLQSQPAWTGPFMIDATMFQCTRAPCFFSVVVYGRPNG